MLQYNEITPHKYIVVDGQPCEVLESHVFRKQQRKPVNQTKLKNLITGKVVERSFHATEQASEANLETAQVKFLYRNRTAYWFCEEDNPRERYTIDEELIGQRGVFMKENDILEIAKFNGNIIEVIIPIKVELKVKEAAAAVKGNTVQGGTKHVTLETGAVVNVPLFINEGDTIRINTETGQYVERVEKK